MIALRTPQNIVEHAEVKKTQMVGVRISEGDLKTIRKAAAKAWPGLAVGNATALLALALQKAREILGRPPKRGKSAEKN
jgi:hypothetical protein